MNRNSSQAVQAAIRRGLWIKKLLWEEEDVVGALGSYRPHRSPASQKNFPQTLANSNDRV